jgi:hypothetical protein
MSNLEKLMARSKAVKIGETEVEVHSLSFDDLVEVTKLGDTNPDIRAKATQDLVKKALKKSFPEATDEQINKFDLQYLGEFINAIFDVSGMKVDEKKLSEMTGTFSA